MGKREVSIGVAAVSALLLLLGVLSHSWWTLSGPNPIGSLGGEVNFGLRSAELCRGGSCVSIPYGATLSSAIFKSVAWATYFGGIAVALMLVGGVAMRELTEDKRLVRSAGGLAFAVLATTLLCMFSFPGRGASIGWSFWATLIGSIGAASSPFLGPIYGGWEGKEYIPITGLDGQKVAKPDTSAAPYRDPSPAPAPSSAPAEAVAPHLASHRIEYSRKVADATSTSGAHVDPRSLARRKAKLSDVGEAAVDSVRSALRFVARSVEISANGLDVITESGEQRIVPWSDIETVIARRLPPDPPFEKTMFIDIVPVAGTSSAAPVRLVPSTNVNYSVLPGTGATSTENFRRFGWFIHHKFPNTLEAESMPFFLESKLAPLFQAVKLFADYDAQYPG